MFEVNESFYNFSIKIIKCKFLKTINYKIKSRFKLFCMLFLHKQEEKEFKNEKRKKIWATEIFNYFIDIS